MDLTIQDPMQYCSLQHQTLLLSTVTSKLGIVFALAQSLHAFWSYCSTDLQQHIGHLPSWGVHLTVSYLFPFHTVNGVLKARALKWFAIPFSSGPHSVRPLHHDPSILGGPTQHGLVSPYYTWAKWGKERLKNFPKVTQLVRVRSGIWI